MRSAKNTATWPISRPLSSLNEVLWAQRRNACGASGAGICRQWHRSRRSGLITYCALTPQLSTSKQDRSSVPLLIFDEGRLTVSRERNSSSTSGSSSFSTSGTAPGKIPLDKGSRPRTPTPQLRKLSTGSAPHWMNALLKWKTSCANSTAT